MGVRLFGVPLPGLNKYEVKQRIFRQENTKKILGVFSLAKLLALRSDSDLRNQAASYDFGIITSQLVHLYMYMAREAKPIFIWFIRSFAHRAVWMRKVVFFSIIVFQYIANIFTIAIITVSRINIADKTKSQTVNSNTFFFEVLKQAQDRQWSVISLNTDKIADKVTTDLIHQLYPSLVFTTWDYSMRSLAVDPTEANVQHITTFYTAFPIFWEVRQFLVNHPHDIVLISTKGTLQEYYFLQELLKDEAIHFKTASILSIPTNLTTWNMWLQQISQCLAFMWYATIDQFITTLDTIKAHHQTISIQITNEQGQQCVSVLDHTLLCELPSEEAFDTVLKKLLSTVSDDFTQFSLQKKVDKQLSPLALTDLDEIAKRGYIAVRDETLHFQVTYHGTDSNIKTGWVFI